MLYQIRTNTFLLAFNQKMQLYLLKGRKYSKKNMEIKVIAERTRKGIEFIKQVAQQGSNMTHIL